MTIRSTFGPGATINGTEAGTVSLSADGNVGVNSLGIVSIIGADGINIGTDLASTPISIGTGAAAKSITVGNSTGGTSSTFFAGTGGIIFTCSFGVFITVIKSGATQGAAGAAANELWKTSGHATLADNVVMIGV